MNRSQSIVMFALAIVAILVAGCSGPHYEKVDGEWKWVTWNEAHGTVHWELEGVHNKTFQVIDENYAKDKNQVYLQNYVVEGANPKTFRVLDVPYATDGTFVFCGSVPMLGVDIESFEVIESSEAFGVCPKNWMLKTNGQSEEDYPYLKNIEYIFSKGKSHDIKQTYIGPFPAK